MAQGAMRSYKHLPAGKSRACSMSVPAQTTAKLDVFLPCEVSLVVSEDFARRLYDPDLQRSVHGALFILFIE